MVAQPPDTLDYARLVRELFPRLTGGIRWGLERTERMLAAVGDPHRRYPVIHVGGTNGKGTVCAVAESILRAAGLRTGLYTSPHLTSFRERVRLDGVPIDVEPLLESARRLWPHIEAEGPSFFEATTAIAFDAFARAEVDVAVVEVGLGGRLDATNVVVPDVALVTQVAIDHVEYLGHDPAGIAAEKAGIAKAGVPFLIGALDPELAAVLASRAGAVGARVHRLPEGEPRVEPGADGRTQSIRLATDAWGTLDVALPLGGTHQGRNAALAVRAIELSTLRDRVGSDAVRRGVASTRWPGRFQRERIDDRDWIFDVAHNPSGIERLVQTLREATPRRPLAVLVGVMGDKDWAPMLISLADAADRLVLTRPEHGPAGRAWDPERAALGLAGRSVEVVPGLRAAVERLRGSEAATVLVTGSFHTVGEAMVALGVDLGWAPDPEPDTALQR